MSANVRLRPNFAFKNSIFIVKNLIWICYFIVSPILHRTHRDFFRLWTPERLITKPLDLCQRLRYTKATSDVRKRDLDIYSLFPSDCHTFCRYLNRRYLRFFFFRVDANSFDSLLTLLKLRFAFADLLTSIVINNWSDLPSTKPRLRSIYWVKTKRKPRSKRIRVDKEEKFYQQVDFDGQIDNTFSRFMVKTFRLSRLLTHFTRLLPDSRKKLKKFTPNPR